MIFKKKQRRVFIIISFLLIPVCTKAQIITQRRALNRLEVDFDSEKKIANANKKKTPKNPTEFTENSHALEKAIDPNEYLVGPGDSFLIQIRGPISSFFETVVTPAGKLIIPEMRNFDVDQRTLKAVQQEIAEAGKHFFNQTVVSADLTSVRNMRVHVLGQVEEPGSYVATPVNRLTDILQNAGWFTDWAATEAIIITHQDKSIDYFNYSAYAIHADLASNIHVRAGDVIMIPGIDLSKPIVYLEADINSPGIYQISPNESIENFLLRLGSLHRNVDFDNATLIRQKSDDNAQEESQLFFDIAELLAAGKNGHSMQLMSGDRIVVPNKLDQVYVRGAVQIPGAFPYFVNFTVEDYAGLAGGTASAASLNKSYVIHNNQKRKGKGEPVQPGDTVVVPENFRTRFRSYFGLAAQLATVVIAINAVSR